jgi:hypothetical protein
VARTSPADVRTVVDVELDDSALAAFIEDAALDVDERIPSDAYSEERLERIEKYLAAHLATFTRERQKSSVGAGSATLSFSGEFGESLRATSPGQNVLRLDHDGHLDENRRRAGYVRSVNPAVGGDGGGST